MPEDRAYGPDAEWAEEVRLALAEVRAKVLSGEMGPVGGERAAVPASVIAAARKRIARRRDPGLVRVVNATGVVLHTNLGRAPIPPAALEALLAHGAGYQLLAADRETGERAPRERHVDALLRRITGAEAVTTVNNSAAATMIARRDGGGKGGPLRPRTALFARAAAWRRPVRVTVTGPYSLVDWPSANLERSPAEGCSCVAARHCDIRY